MSAEQGIPISNQSRPVNLLEIANRTGGLKPQSKSGRESFNEVFKTELNGGESIQFSRHAEARIHSRGIKMDAETVSRLVRAIEKGVLTERFTDHDVRAKSGSDSETDEDAAALLADTVQTVRKAYRRKAEKVRPLE